MKKIGLFLEVEPHGGGAFQYCQSVLSSVSNLPKDKFTVVIGCTSDEWLKHLKNDDRKIFFIKKGFWSKVSYAWWTFDLPVGIFRYLSPYLHPVARALIKENCDLWIFPSQNIWSYQVPVPALVSIYDLMHRYEHRFMEVSENGGYRLRESLYRNICKWAKGILVDSRIGKQHVIESYGVESSKVYVLPYVAPSYMYSAQVPDDFESKYKLPAKFIFYPAQFWEHKNHKSLIGAISKLRLVIPDLRLVLVGSKKNGYESAVKLVHDLGIQDSVFFLGYVPDEYMPEFYRRARALVMPTFFGPTNIPPLEAFVTSCPVAISNIYGIPEQLGDAALYFNPESVDEIAQCIEKLWHDDDLRKRLVQKGKDRIRIWGQSQFDAQLKKIIEQIVEI